MDFVSDQLYNGKRFRALAVLNTFSRESLAIYMDKSNKNEQVCDELEKIKAARGLP
jgi:putative transposase